MSESKHRPPERVLVSCAEGVGGTADVGDKCDLRSGRWRVQLIETYGPDAIHLEVGLVSHTTARLEPLAEP